MEANSRISDVLHTLADPVEYVRGIVGSFVEYQFNKATSVVRIGISGRGIVPNYSIETPSDPDPTALIKTWVSKNEKRCASVICNAVHVICIMALGLFGASGAACAENGPIDLLPPQQKQSEGPLTQEQQEQLDRIVRLKTPLIECVKKQAHSYELYSSPEKADVAARAAVGLCAKEEAAYRSALFQLAIIATGIDAAKSAQQAHDQLVDAALTIIVSERQRRRAQAPTTGETETASNTHAAEEPKADSSFRYAMYVYDHYLVPEDRKRIESLIGGMATEILWANADLASRKQPLLYCQPDKLVITDSQMLNMMRRAVKDNPKLDDYPIGMVVLVTLQRTFPCKR